MQVLFERSGGYTGVLITLTLDTATLSTPEVAQLHHLVDAAGFFALPTTIFSSPQPDRFQYQITIRESERQHTVRVGESAVPNALKPLLDWLMEAARKYKQ